MTCRARWKLDGFIEMQRLPKAADKQAVFLKDGGEWRMENGTQQLHGHLSQTMAQIPAFWRVLGVCQVPGIGLVLWLEIH